MNRIAGRAGITLLIALLLVAGMAFFVMEFVVEADDWIFFPGSPHVYSSGKVGTGVFTDREGEMVLDLSEDRSYSDDSLLRQAMLHWTGDREGNVSTPALENYPLEMTGYDLLNGVYAYGEGTFTARMTLSAQAQKAALEALGDYHGTVAVYNYETGELLCAVSTPSFDPDHVPDVAGDTTGRYDGIYLNRFTQASFVPGSIFKIVTLAAALETVKDIEDRTFICTGTYEYGIDQVTCGGAHYEQTLKEAFANSCNCAFAQIAELIGGEKLQQYAEQFMITEPVNFDGISTAEGNFQVENAEDVELAWGAIGQFTDQVNPARFMTFMGAIAGGGVGAEPYVISEIAIGDGTTYYAKTSQSDRLMSRATAKILGEYLQNNVNTVYGDWNFPGLTVCAKSGTGEVGEGKEPNAMFAGFVADEKYPLAFIVAVEEGGYGAGTCMPILAPVLEACKEVMDRE